MLNCPADVVGRAVNLDGSLISVNELTGETPVCGSDLALNSGLSVTVVDETSLIPLSDDVDPEDVVELSDGVFALISFIIISSPWLVFSVVDGCVDFSVTDPLWW